MVAAGQLAECNGHEIKKIFFIDNLRRYTDNSNLHERTQFVWLDKYQEDCGNAMEYISFLTDGECNTHTHNDY